MPTTNPVPSRDPGDLLFNAGKLDEVVNGTSAYYADRLGVNRRTIEGINAAADVVLAGLGYAPPVAYAAGISLTLATQTVEYSGEVYAPKVADLPFTTSGTFETAKFRLIQGVASADLPALVGQDLQDHSALRAYTGRATRVYITGLLVTAKPAGITGTFQYDPTDTTSLDNGGTIIVGADGRRWKRDYSGAINVMWFMTPAQAAAVIANDLSQDVTAPIQAAFSVTSAFAYEFPDGLYKVTSTITVPMRAVGGDNARKAAIRIFGTSRHRSRIYQATTGTNHLFSVTAEAAQVDHGIYVEEMGFTSSYGNTSGGYAFRIAGAINSQFKGCNFTGLGGGAVWITNTNTNLFDDCFIFGCGNNPAYAGVSLGDYNYGAVHLPRAVGYTGNGLSIDGCYISNNQGLDGVVFQGVSFRMSRSTVESCLNLLNIGSSTTSTSAVNVAGCYFENSYRSNIKISNVSNAEFNNCWTSNGTSGSGFTNRQGAVVIDGAINSDIVFSTCVFTGLAAKSGIAVNPISINRNIKFKNCRNVVFSSVSAPTVEVAVHEGISVDTEEAQQIAFGGFGSVSNMLAYSDDPTNWTNNNCTFAADKTFIDGAVAYTATSAISNAYDFYRQISITASAGTFVTFSAFIRSGSASLKIRARRVSDSVYEDIVSKVFTESNGSWTRVWVTVQLQTDYNIMQFRVSPGGYSGVGSVGVTRMAVSRTALPQPPMLTDLNAINSTFQHVVNGSTYQTGPLGLKDGVTAPAAVPGVAQLYVDATDGDLKVIFGDGVVKTIVADV